MSTSPGAQQLAEATRAAEEAQFDAELTVPVTQDDLKEAAKSLLSAIKDAGTMRGAGTEQARDLSRIKIDATRTFYDFQLARYLHQRDAEKERQQEAQTTASNKIARNGLIVAAVVGLATIVQVAVAVIDLVKGCK